MTAKTRYQSNDSTQFLRLRSSHMEERLLLDVTMVWLKQGDEKGHTDES